MSIEVNLGGTKYVLREPVYELEMQIENNTIDLVDGKPVLKEGVGHMRFVRLRLYLQQIGDKTNITDKDVKQLHPEHAGILLDVIDGLPPELAEKKYNQNQKLKEEVIKKEKESIDLISSKLADVQKGKNLD